MNTRKILSVLICVFAMHSMLAKEIYVATSGSDTNKGSKDAPFLTIDKARLVVKDLLQNGLKENIIFWKIPGLWFLFVLRIMKM